MAERRDREYGGARPKDSRRGHNVTDSYLAGPFAGSYVEGNVTYIEQSAGSNDGKKDAEKESERYQKWCKDRADKHVRTSLYHQALKELREKKSVLLLADAGDGKSTLLELLAIQYGEDGFVTLEIDTPADINSYNTDGKKVLFVCDNLLGETEINEDKTKAWKNSESKEFSDEAKFVFACRLEFWGRKKADLCRKQIFNDTVVVRSDQLTYTDKKEMLDRHVGDRICESTKKQIAEKCNFAFPECCRFVSHSLNIDFSDSNKLVEIFSKPFQFVIKQLESLEKNNKIQYAILLFCLINEKEFPQTGRSDVCKKSNFEVVRKLYLSAITCSAEQLYDTMLDNVKKLDGWLLTQEGDKYTFYHDSIFEAMCRLHGDRYPEHILTFCKPELVFSVFTTNQVSGSDSDRVTLPPHCYPQLVEVVTTECVKEWELVNSEMWRFVFEQMNRTDILKEWSVFLKAKEMSLPEEIPPRLLSSEHTEPTLFDVLKLMTKQPGCGLTVRYVFVYAAYHGDLQTSTLALESGVDSGDRVYGLMCAADQGHSNIVRLTVQRTYPDIQDMSYIEELCEAMSSVRVERVVEMIRSQPDINTDMQHMVLLWAARWGHVDVFRVTVERTDMDMEGIEMGLAQAVEYDNVECIKEILRLHPDIDTDTIHRLLKFAVECGSVWSVRKLLKRPNISEQTIQEMLRKDDSELFSSHVTQSDRDKTRSVLVKHLNLYSESIASGLCAAVEHDNVEMVRQILRVHPDIDTVIIHEVLKFAVRCASVRSVIVQTKQNWLDTDEDELFWSFTQQTKRDEIRTVLVKHLDPYSECTESWLLSTVEYDNVDTDMIHWVINFAVRCGSVESVLEVLKRPDISKQTIQEMLRKDDSKLFEPRVTQTVRDEIRAVLVEHLDTDTESIACGLYGAAEHDDVEMVRHILGFHPDIDTDTMHTVLKFSVRCGSVWSVGELLKRPGISRQMIQNWLDTDEDELFWLFTPQTKRDETRSVLVKHLTNDS